jgi:UDP-N-acetylglucosamine diphosphorylase/glucosamine-1-phosphate N-acetyltransferase
MAAQICVFEDVHYVKLLPLVYLRPVYNLRCGILKLKEKIARAYPKAELALHCRDYLVEYIRMRNPGTKVNHISEGECLFINGRVLADQTLSKVIPLKGKGDCVYMVGEQIAAARVSGGALRKLRSRLGELLSPSDFEGLPREEVKVTLVDYPWSIVHRNGAELVKDFELLMKETKGKRIRGSVAKGVHLLGKDNLFIEKGASIKPGAVLDAENGPIYIAKDVKVFPQATMIGPAFVGPGSMIKVGAQIYENTSIGPICKVGGEIEGSIIHGYSNKQHAGFLGHAYVGSWVNLGADTNNSDLKNNYGTVKVQLGFEEIDTGLQFVGLTMGDHSKSAINSQFNTGTVVGVFCNIFGHGFPPKYVPSFSWGAAGETFTTFHIDQAIDVGRRVMARRKIDLTAIEEKLFRKVFEITTEYRRRKGMPR